MFYIDLLTKLHAQTCNALLQRTLLLAKVNPLAHFNAKWQKNQLELEIPQLSKISDDAG